MRSLTLVSCWQQSVDRSSKLRIQIAEAPQVVGGEFDADAVVDVAPIGVMVASFSQQGHTTHEAEGFDEILLPGEIESKVKRKRTEEGIFVEDKTWEQILKWSQKFGVELE